jgi:hypothetical protein
MGFLTDRAFITGVTKTNLFHLVDVNDISQGNPDGSSYKASVFQLIDLLDTQYITITGGTMTGPLSVPNLTANTSTIGTLNVTGDTNTSGLTANTSTIGNLEVTGDTNTNTLSASTAQTETLVIVNDPTEVYTNEVLVRNSITGEVEKKDLTHYNFGFYVQTGDSASVSNTVVETSILDGGIGSLSVPANGFSVGDSFHVKVGGTVSSLNGATLTFRIKSGSVVLGTESITFTNGVTSRSWEFNCDFTIRSIGTATNASVVSNGTFTYNVSSDVYGAGFTSLNNTTFDTTILNTLSFTVEWGAASASNTIYSSMCILTKTF